MKRGAWAFREASTGHRPFQELSQLGERSRVEHVIGSQPAAPGLIDAKPHILQRID